MVTTNRIGYLGIFLLLSCTSPKHGQLVEVRDVEIPFPVPPQGPPGVYTNALEEEVLFFSSPGNYCCMDFFSYPGLEKIYGIPLDSLPGIESGIDGVYVSDTDSVRLMLHDNTELVVDSKGKPIARNEFSSRKPAGIDAMYPEANPQTGKYIHTLNGKRNYVFTGGFVDWPPDTGSEVNRMKAYQTLQRGLPSVALAQVDGGTGRFTVDDADLFARMGNTQNLMAPKIVRCAVAGDRVLVYADFSDKLFVFSGNGLRFEKEIRLKSEYTDIGIPRLEITFENVTGAGEILNDLRMKHGAIADIHPDTANNRLFIVLMHTVPPETPKHKSWNKRPWSLLVTDLDFNPLDEVKMPGGIYNPYLFMVVRDGILLGLSEDNPKYGENKVQYKLVRYERE